MEEQLAELTAQVAALKGGGATTNTMFAEMFYYLTIPLMIIIHAGFLAYEMGSSRVKNVLVIRCKEHSGVRLYDPNLLFLWLVGLLGLSNRLTLVRGPAGISGAAYANSIAWGWGDSAQYMGPNIATNASGVFFGAFALFAATTASIMSGAVIERIQTVGFVILAIVLGSLLGWLRRLGVGMLTAGWLRNSVSMTLAQRALCTRLLVSLHWVS